MVPPPAATAGVAQPVVSLNGPWKVTTNAPPEFWNNTVDPASWGDIRVPSHAVPQGVIILRGGQYVFKKKFAIPSDFAGKRILLQFDGVAGQAKAWINGVYLRDHFGAFTTWNCDITGHAVPGEEAWLTVSAVDGNEGLSGYNNGGILRSVRLVAVLTRLTGYWSHQSTRDIPGNDPLPDPITAKRDKTAVNDTFTLNVNRSITPTLIVHAGSGFTRFHNPDSSSAAVLGYDAMKNLGLTGASVNPSGFPRIGGLSTGTFGGMSFSMGPSNANNYFNDILNINADATWSHRSHTYKLGAQFKNEMWSDRNTRGAQGIYGFGASQTSFPAMQGVSLPSGTGIGFNYASFLLGLTSPRRAARRRHLPTTRRVSRLVASGLSTW